MRGAYIAILTTPHHSLKMFTPEAPASLPSSQELEKQGAVIGEIKIVNNNVFAVEQPEENYALFRLADRLHIRTRAEVLRDQLLFKSGERYSHRLLRESERILRADRYLYDAQIVPVHYENGVVDLEVRTRDVWTFKPGIQYGRSGGTNTTGFELQESNVFGFGKEATIGHLSDVDRTSTEVRYFDPHLFGSWNQFLAAYADNSDGKRSELLLEHPFYSLDSRWTAVGNWFEWDRITPRYSLGHIVDEFQNNEEHLQLNGGSSSGWSNGWITRWTYGAIYDRDRFLPTGSANSAQVLPADRVVISIHSWALCGSRTITLSDNAIQPNAPKIFMQARSCARASVGQTKPGERIAMQSSCDLARAQLSNRRNAIVRWCWRAQQRDVSKAVNCEMAWRPAMRISIGASAIDNYFMQLCMAKLRMHWMRIVRYCWAAIRV